MLVPGFDNSGNDEVTLSLSHTHVWVGDCRVATAGPKIAFDGERLTVESSCCGPTWWSHCRVAPAPLTDASAKRSRAATLAGGHAPCHS